MPRVADPDAPVDLAHALIIAIIRQTNNLRRHNKTAIILSWTPKNNQYKPPREDKSIASQNDINCHHPSSPDAKKRREEESDGVKA